jgi:xanthine dehydrogenase YagT iron-sulfur-binding subunit
MCAEYRAPLAARAPGYPGGLVIMGKISRRKFLHRTGAGLAATTVVASRGTTPRAQAPGTPPPGAPTHEVRLVVNGGERRVRIEDRWSLAEVLRDHLGLTGTKIGCERGECGACTVVLNGVAVYSCSYLAAWAEGASIQTVEGLARGGALDPLQQSFIEHDGPQCGFCTSGQLMAAKALLGANPHPSEDQVRRGLAGNICRCSNYNRYVEAVMAVAQAPAPRTGQAAQPANTVAGAGGGA